MSELRFDLKRFKRCHLQDGTPITSFTMRETNGQDEEWGANQAKAKGGSATATEELIRFALVTVNDEIIKQPYLQFDGWSSRARGFAIAAWRNLNAVEEAEANAFLSDATVVGEEPSLAAVK
jgi:hypothetical protein